MRRSFRLALTATAVGVLTVATAAPAGAQEEPAALGFAVDKTQAQPGTLVLGKANAADVAEHCLTELEPFQARFTELFQGPLEVAPGGPIFDRLFPTGEVVFENHDQLAYAFIALAALGIGANINGAAEDALPQTFVMTFADIATQDPVGERGNFDPNTGDGSVVVPDIKPGNWAVAAACVGPSFDVDVLEAGIRQGGDFLEELGAPVDPNDFEAFQEFVDEFFGEPGHSGLDLIAALGPTLLEPIMVPDAFGAVIFCVLDDQGNCPGEEPPPPELKPEETKQMTPPAQPVVAAPSFTG